MLRAGFLNVKVLLGGFDEWVRAYGERLVVTFATVFVPNQ
jgi:3-mercaptopyruvate sulfurtransferase SseA